MPHENSLILLSLTHTLKISLFSINHQNEHGGCYLDIKNISTYYVKSLKPLT